MMDNLPCRSVIYIFFFLGMSHSSRPHIPLLHESSPEKPRLLSRSLIYICSAESPTVARNHGLASPRSGTARQGSLWSTFHRNENLGNNFTSLGFHVHYKESALSRIQGIHNVCGLTQWPSSARQRPKASIFQQTWWIVLI